MAVPYLGLGIFCLFLICYFLFFNVFFCVILASGYLGSRDLACLILYVKHPAPQRDRSLINVILRTCIGGAAIIVKKDGPGSDINLYSHKPMKVYRILLVSEIFQ